jgi:hypothetical protein
MLNATASSLKIQKEIDEAICGFPMEGQVKFQYE